jgi:phosphomannomutase / phosphoglucomutase
MNINSNIFRAYDIRGTALPTAKKPEPDITPELFELIGRATATYLQRKDHATEMVVGRDNRLHSEKLQQAFINGVRKAGLKVIDIGLATSPMIYYATCKYGYTSGANITASHNPKEENGIKFVRKDAHCVAGDEIQEILKLMQNGDLITSEKPAEIEIKTDLFSDYLAEVKSKTNLTRPIKVVVDTGNGVAGKYLPELLRAVGCEVIEIFTELDGNFPNHEANPEQPKNMVDLGKKVVETNADCGIGIDGDGDRIGMVDENGKFQSIEAPLIILARDLLKNLPGEKIIFDVKVSQNLIGEIEKHGGKPIMSRTGHSFIEERLHKEDAPLAGEKSGHLFMNKKHFNYYGFDDAMFAACKILEAFSKSTHKFSEHFTDLPKLISTSEQKAVCPDHLKFQIIEKLQEHFCQQYNCITIDGARILFDQNSWGLIRASNTSPAFTLLFEAPTQERLNEIREILFTEIRKYPEVELPENR